MNIDEAFRFVNFIISKETNGSITADNFNLNCPIAQLSVINQRLSPKYDEKGMLIKGFGVDDKIREDFKPILKDPQTISVAAGVASYPDDYLYLDSITTTTGLPITEATPDEIAILNQSQIKPPTVLYPKYVLHQNGFNIYPTSLTNIKLAYLRKPETPIRNFTNVNDRSVYNSSGSQDFELGVLTHLEICLVILQYAGVNLNLDKVVGYSVAMQQAGA
jgi:hypothetical protein